MIERTTDLNDLKNGAPFTWGKMIKLHEIGPYVVGEFHPWKVDGCTILTSTVNPNRVEFHIWIDGKDASMGFDSLDAAIVGAISYRHEGPNAQSAYYFMKMIGKASNEVEEQD